MNEIIFDPDARSEFLEAIQYYENCQKDLGRRFRNAVEDSIRRISESPLMYRVLHSPFRRFLINKFPYAIIYTIEPESIRIIAVAHTKRKPYFWKYRIQEES